MAGLLDGGGAQPGLLGNLGNALWAYGTRTDPQDMQVKRQRAQILQSLGPNPSLSDVGNRLLKIGDMEGFAAISRMADANAQREWTKTYQGGMLDIARQGANEPKIFGSGEGGYYMLPRGAGAGAAPAQPGGMPGTPTPLPGGATQLVPPRQSIDREQLKKDIGRVELYKTQADAGRQTLADIAQLRELRKGVGYEGGLFAGPRSTVAGWMGHGGGQAIEAKASDLALTLSEKMKGAASNQDMALITKGTPGISMTDDAAEQTLNGWEAVGLRSVERGKFFEAWMKTHKGLSGAQEAWDQFINERPIISGGGAAGKIKVNRDNVAAWKPYIGGDPAPAPTGGVSITGAKSRTGDATPPGVQYDSPDIVDARKAVATGKISKQEAMRRLLKAGVKFSPGDLD